MGKIPRVNITEATYSAVKQVLLSSKYSPGGRVAIDELCRSLDVSRTPVFDALNRLETEGLVEIVPRKGVYLVTFSREKAYELYAVREVLEGMATRLSAKNLTDKQLDQLRKNLEKQSSSLETGDTEGYASATIKFHNIILEAAANKTLERSLSAIYSQMEALRLRSFAEHQQIFQALLKRDPELCEREARKHVVATANYAIGLLEQSSQLLEQSGQARFKPDLAESDA
jgi:DNA-binding GntR family transcriptional regulator